MNKEIIKNKFIDELQSLDNSFIKKINGFTIFIDETMESIDESLSDEDAIIYITQDLTFKFTGLLTILNIAVEKKAQVNYKGNILYKPNN